MNEYTLTLYYSPILALVMWIVASIRGISMSDLLYRSDLLDWLLYTILGFFSIASNTVRMIALRYDKPAKITQYGYLENVYSLLFDIIVFNQFFPVVQQIGVGIMFLGFAIKFYLAMKAATASKSDKSQHDNV